jgi:hypothetical protein
MERLTRDKNSICERSGANANAGADKCELQNWCVSDGETVKADKSQIGIGDTAVFKVSYATNSVCVEGSQAGGDGRVKKVTVAVHKWALDDTELQVIAVRPPSFRSLTATVPRLKWSTLDSSDLSSDCCASTFSMWRFTSTHFTSLTNLNSLKGRVANDTLRALQLWRLNRHAFY